MRRIDNHFPLAQDRNKPVEQTNKPWLKATELIWPNKIVDNVTEF
jgi:hypothetical protein